MKVTIETNLHITEYLDITFNLKTGKYYPYRKQNNSLQYIYVQSNHLPSIIKRIPSMISRQLSDISSDKVTLTKLHLFIMRHRKIVVLMKHLTFSPTIPTTRHRGRNIIWFNPPFTSNVKTNVGKLF